MNTMKANISGAARENDSKKDSVRFDNSPSQIGQQLTIWLLSTTKQGSVLGVGDLYLIACDVATGYATCNTDSCLHNLEAEQMSERGVLQVNTLSGMEFCIQPSAGRTKHFNFAFFHWPCCLATLVSPNLSMLRMLTYTSCAHAQDVPWAWGVNSEFPVC